MLNDKIKRLNKVLTIKEMRRKMAELEVARAHGAVRIAEGQLQAAEEHEQETIRNGDLLRQERMKALLDENSNPAVENARIRNAYQSVDYQIQSARFQIEHRMTELGDAQDSARLKQQQMARLLQREERTRKLCERLSEQKQQEDMRHE